ncbi:MAG: tetratricopeptide repeat protein [Bacteroidaceae bacterium]|nr:tetratricopeptide repeat protein [Bacteroidaceae bacterium]
MKRYSILLMLLSVLAWSPAMVSGQPSGDTQKSATLYKKSAVMKSYRTCMKEKNYTKARQVIESAIVTYMEAAADPQLYRYNMDALNELIGIENRKIYLKSNPDTVRYFNYMYDLYAMGLKCDSVEQARLHERRVMGKKAEPKLRAGAGLLVLPYMKNLLNAGKFHYRKRNYAQAFRFFDMYARAKSSEFLSTTKEAADWNDDQTEVAVLAVLSAYASGNNAATMVYLPESLGDESVRARLLEIGSKAAAELHDDAAMLALLEQGFDAYPDVNYFLMALVKYYNDTEQFDEALCKVQRMTLLYPNTRDYWYMMGKELMLLGQYDAALASFERCVEIKADDAESYSALGNIYLHEAQEAYVHFNMPLSDPSYTTTKKAITGLYEKSCAAFEKARKFDEENRDLWLSGLRETYFKLNKGRELRALEKYK